MSDRTRQRHALFKLWAKARKGNLDAVDELYRIALKTLPARAKGDADPTVSAAVLKVLCSATKDNPITDACGIILHPRKFKKAVVLAVKGEVDDKTVQRFINNSDKMFPVVARSREMTKKKSKS